MGAAPYVQKIKGSFFLTNFMNLFHEFIALLSCHFALLCSIIASSSSLCYGEMKEFHV